MPAPLEPGLGRAPLNPSGVSPLKGWRRRTFSLFLFGPGQSRPRHHTRNQTFSPECQRGKRLPELKKGWTRGKTAETQ